MVLVFVGDPVDPLLQDLDPIRPEDRSVVPGTGLHIAQTMVNLALKNELPMAAVHHLRCDGK